MNLAVIYDSITGNTKMAAEWIISGMNEMTGVNAKSFPIQTVDEEFVSTAKGIVIGSPSYASQMTPEMHTWLLKTGAKLPFAGKLAGAFSTQQYTDGGGDLVIQSIMTIETVKGMLFYSGGGAYGKPVIHLGPVAVNNNVEKHNGMEYYKDSFAIYGRRFAKKALELFGSVS